MEPRFSRPHGHALAVERGGFSCTPVQQALVEQDHQWKASATGPWDREDLRRCVRAGGGSEGFFQDVFNELEAKFAREQQAIATGTFHAAYGSLCYLVSGRKR